MKRIALAVVLLGSPATPTWAGYDEGVAAYDRGDYPTALREFEESATQGDAHAQLFLGVMYDRGSGMARDYATAATWYRRAAEQGVARAQFNLGVMTERGEGVAQDYAEAADWYRRAAKQDHARAQFSLGVLYSIGQGVPQDFIEAASWYRLAASQGIARAMNNIGLLYQKGLGVPLDLTKAYAWYSQAVSHYRPGPPKEQAVRNRDGVANELSPQQLERARKLARQWSTDSSPGTVTSPGAGPDTTSGPVAGTAATSPGSDTAGPVTTSQTTATTPARALVARVQEELARAGYDPGPANGIMSPATRAAIRAFQAANDIPATGQISSEFLCRVARGTIG